MDGLFTLLAFLALAQPTDPALTDPSLDEEAAELAQRRANPPTIMPAADPVVRVPLPGQPGPGEVVAGIRASDLGVPLGSLYAEGTFLVRRAGAMLQAPTGEWVYVFNPSPEGQFDTPMVLVPSAELEHVLPTISQDESPRPLVVTGQVLVYGGRNYLIPLSIIDAPAEVVQAGEGDQGAAPVEPPTAEELASDPDVASLIADLEAQRDVPRGLAPRPVEAAGTTRESLLTPTAIQTIPEGTMLVRRKARMVREATGAWALVLDNDSVAGGGAASTTDATRLILLPCQNLAEMERLAAGTSEEAAFEVTVRVLSFQGRNYAMPLMFALMRGSDVRGLQ